MDSRWLGLSLFAAAVTGVLLCVPRGGDPAEAPAATGGGPVPAVVGGPAPATAPADVARPEPPPAVRTDHKVPIPLHRPSGKRPGTRTPVRELPKVDDGIRLPDGTCLPYLNGMNWAPPLQRDRIHGPVPPVVAILVDAEGFEWYEHADGSVTTCMYQQVIVQGEPYWDPTTKHSAAVPRSMLRTDDGGR
jgi:hypothetical protein